MPAYRRCMLGSSAAFYTGPAVPGPRAKYGLSGSSTGLSLCGATPTTDVCVCLYISDLSFHSANKIIV